MIPGASCERSQTRAAGINALLPAEGELPHPASLWLCSLGIMAKTFALLAFGRLILTSVAEES